jgi:hypothetical protein
MADNLCRDKNLAKIRLFDKIRAMNWLIISVNARGNIAAAEEKEDEKSLLMN